jgi:hypothetical protein
VALLALPAYALNNSSTEHVLGAFASVCQLLIKVGCRQLDTVIVPVSNQGSSPRNTLLPLLSEDANHRG